MKPGARLPFGAWLAGATVSELGDAVTVFAVAWVASGLGPHVLGVVLSVEGVPAFVFLLVGGVVADAWGIRRTMLLCNAGLLVVLALAAATVSRTEVTVTLLVVLALAVGALSSLHRPAAGVFPRLFAGPEALPRLLALTSSSLQVARVCGPVVAGFLLAAGGFSLTAAVDALTYAVVLVVLWWVRPPEPQVREDRRSDGRGALSAFRLAWRTPSARPLLLAVAGVAVSVISTVSLGVPLLGRAHDWTAARAGLVSSGWLVGTLAVTVYVAWRGVRGRYAMPLGPVVGAGGVVVLATAGSVPVAMAGTVLLGVGTSLFTTRALPMFVAISPPEALARFQALLGIAQSGPLLVATPLLGLVATTLGARGTVLLLAGILLASCLAARSANRSAPDRGVPRPAPNLHSSRARPTAGGS